MVIDDSTAAAGDEDGKDDFSNYSRSDSVLSQSTSLILVILDNSSGWQNMGLVRKSKVGGF